MMAQKGKASGVGRKRKKNKKKGRKERKKEKENAEHPDLDIPKKHFNKREIRVLSR